MTVAMMLPVLLPTLRRYRAAVGVTAGARLDLLTALVGAGYFAVWTAFGVAAYPLGSALAALAMQQPGLSRAVPAGNRLHRADCRRAAVHGWKARRLACCRNAPGHERVPRPAPAAPGVSDFGWGFSAPDAAAT